MWIAYSLLFMAYFFQIDKESPHIVEVIYIEEVSVIFVHDGFQNGIGHHWGISFGIKKAIFFSLVPVLIALVEGSHFLSIEPEGFGYTLVKVF